MSRRMGLHQSFGPKVKTLIATFTSSGTWTVPAGIREVDVYLVGGGGVGYKSANLPYGGGGGGGYCKLHRSVEVVEGQSIEIVIGSGGGLAAPWDDKGGSTSFGNLSVAGGMGAMTSSSGNGGDGGSGGGGGGAAGGSGGSDGESWGGSSGGLGGGTVNFDPINPYSNEYYGGGGGGARYSGSAALGGQGGGGAVRYVSSGVNGIPNTGGGGGGGYNNNYYRGAGGSGIVLIYG